jgi:hypothetical protein
MKLGPLADHLRRRRARLLGRTVLRFLHIRKTGGTALREALGRRRETPSHLILFEGHGFRIGDRRPGEKIAFVWRDPISRAVSGFSSRQRQGRPRYHFPWSPEEEEAFGRFPNLEALALALGRDRPEAQAAMRGIRHLNHGYAFWFGSVDRLLAEAEDVAFIGRQDHLEEDFERLRRAVRLPLDMGLPGDPVRAHRSPVPAAPLSDTARAALRAWYAEDYAFVTAFEEIGARLDARQAQNA